MRSEDAYPFRRFFRVLLSQYRLMDGIGNDLALTIEERGKALAHGVFDVISLNRPHSDIAKSDKAARGKKSPVTLR